MPVDLSPIEISPGERTEIAEFGASHRTSMLTLMFTDLAGSTEMWEQLGENAASKLRREHHQMEQEIVERDNGGRVIKTIGDAIFAVFAEPSRAVERAMEIQLELHARNQVRSQKLQERIGLHLGQVLLEHHVVDDVFGRHVNRAARIEGSTPPGHATSRRGASCDSIEPYPSSSRSICPCSATYQQLGEASGLLLRGRSAETGGDGRQPAKDPSTGAADRGAS